MNQPNYSADRIADVDALDDLLSQPTPEVIESLARCEGDILFLGIGGKIGPSLARMARRACDAAGSRRRLYGVARFSSPQLPEQLQALRIEPIRCDLLDRDKLAALPDAPNVFFLAGFKFGATNQEPKTWAMNCYLPGLVCERYRQSRIAAYSTGNVYGLVPVSGSGSQESDALNPAGDYAMSCLGRERIFTHFCLEWGLRLAILRLNYAVEMRYGVPVDIADQVLSGNPVNVAMGYFNAIWQGDSNAMTLRSLEHAASPPAVFNLAGPDKLRLRDVAEELGRLMGRTPQFTGQEADDALLSDGRHGYELLGRPQVSVSQMLRWIADWKLRGGPSLGKPTHFQTRDGKF